ncbi:uncharacterized protein LOC141623161 [Silene latifolia]|uniref:uncharacterized protein LOC141623161 n=1 Tax=Silene latifolia TaxID=37657 RepID=UPI003D76B598
MCGGDQKCIETVEHLFRDCSLTRRLWAGSTLGIRVDSATGISISDWIYDWLSYLSNSGGSEDNLITFVAVLWGLWTLRNNVIFQKLDLNSSTITGCFYNSIREKIQMLCNSSLTKQPLSLLQTSEEGSTYEERAAIRNGYPVRLIGNHSNCEVVRVKVDASWVPGLDAAFGWIAFDHTGQELERGMVRAGVIAMQSLINQIAGLEKEDHLIAGILADLRDRLSLFHCLSLSFIPRRLNVLAHGLAKQAMRL